MSRFLSEKLSALVPYTPGEQPQGVASLIKLNTNESPFPPSPRVVEAISGEEVEKLRLYPDPVCTDFVSAVAEYHGVPAENVFPGNGSDEILALIFHGMCQGGCAFPDITYGFYKVYANMFGVDGRQIPLREDFSLCVDDYAGISGTVIIANPNAPTGLYLPVSDIETLLNQDTDRLVIVDEAYVEFGGESCLPLLSRYDNLLIVRTLSKSRSLAGARLGYALSSPEIISDLNTMRFSFNPYNLNRLSLLAGKHAMEDVDYFEKTRAQIIEARDFTRRELLRLGFNVLDSRTNFLLAGGNPDMPGDEFYRRLRENGILVRYFNEPRLRDYVRITIGTKDEMLRLVSATEEILGGQ